MDQDVDQVIAKYIELTEVVVEGEGEVDDRPCSQKFPQGGKIRQVPDLLVFFDGVVVVKDEGDMPGVTVDRKGDTGYDDQREPPRINNPANFFHPYLLSSSILAVRSCRSAPFLFPQTNRAIRSPLPVFTAKGNSQIPGQDKNLASKNLTW